MLLAQVLTLLALFADPVDAEYPTSSLEADEP